MKVARRVFGPAGYFGNANTWVPFLTIGKRPVLLDGTPTGTKRKTEKEVDRGMWE